jgi:oligogalacturonide transport system ATP-binding protein
MLAGLETISGGEVRIGEKIVNNLAPKERGIAMVFQNYALYPHMTVRENLAFGLKLSKLPKDQIESQVNEAAKILELEELLDRLPRQLSGGQAQRVAVGRAIVKNRTCSCSMNRYLTLTPSCAPRCVSVFLTCTSS